METIEIRTTKSREELKEVIRSIPGTLAGTSTGDPLGLRKGFASRVAVQFFTAVHRDFKIKSKGGKGEGGITWQRNTPEYLAYKKGKKRPDRWGSGQMPMNKPGGPKKNQGKIGRGRGTGMLTPAQLRFWWEKYLTSKSTLMTRGMDLKQAQQISAKKAWVAVKAEMSATTLLEKYGSQRHKVLVDRTKKLINSVAPGTIASSNGYSGDYVKSKNQLYRPRKGSITVGTRVEYAGYHHEGRGHNPERRLWPEELPPAWLRKINRSVTDQMKSLARSFE